jgi:hypothetical protein
MVLNWLGQIFQAARSLFRETIKSPAPPNLPTDGDWVRLRRHEFDERLGKVLWTNEQWAGVKWIVGGDGRALLGDPCIVHLCELEKVS